MVSDFLSVENKTVIVTGAGRGLGRAIAFGLSRLGANVIVAGRTAGDVEVVAREIERFGGEAHPKQFDATKAGASEELVRSAVAWKDTVHGAIISHGISLHEEATRTSTDEFRDVVETNLVSCFDCSRSVGCQLIQQRTGGSIVLISSNGSIVAYNGLAAYGASKGGVDQLCRQLAAEWAPNKVRVNAIAPGYMNSFMRGTEHKYGDEKFRKAISDRIPMRRWGEPEDLVGAAAFLLSDSSSYVTGQYIAIDGGYSIV